MGDEGEKVPPEESRAELETKPSVRMMEHLEKRKKSKSPRRSTMNQEKVDVDRTALEAILDISSRIQGIQKKSKVSMSTLALAHESYKDKQVNKLE